VPGGRVTARNRKAAAIGRAIRAGVPGGALTPRILLTDADMALSCPSAAGSVQSPRRCH